MRKQIEALLKSNISTSAIAKGAGLPWSTVADLRNGKTNLVKMSLLTAEKLQKYAEEMKMEKAKQLLEEIKNNDVAYAIVNEDGAVYCNRETSNIMDVYGHDGEDGHFYGVYGDLVDGQIDSRKVSDDVILKAIELMLNFGKPVKRSELPKDADKKFTYYFGDYVELLELHKKFGLI